VQNNRICVAKVKKKARKIVYEKQNSGTCTAHPGRCSNSVTETDGFREIGIPRVKSRCKRRNKRK
jgi:hypothetical protein